MAGFLTTSLQSSLTRPGAVQSATSRHPHSLPPSDRATVQRRAVPGRGAATAWYAPASTASNYHQPLCANWMLSERRAAAIRSVRALYPGPGRRRDYRRHGTWPGRGFSPYVLAVSRPVDLERYSRSRTGHVTTVTQPNTRQRSGPDQKTGRSKTPVPPTDPQHSPDHQSTGYSPISARSSPSPARP